MTSLPHRNDPSSTRTLRLSYGPELEQFGELYLPSGIGPHPVVILIHGGFWRAPYAHTLMTNLAKDLVRRRIATWNIEYRRIGNFNGGWPNTFLDVARAADYLRTAAPAYRLDLQRVVTIGHSAGGHLALWLAARPHIPKDSILANAATSNQAGQENPTPLPITAAISLAGVSDLAMGWQLNLGNGAVAELLGGSPSDLPEHYTTASPAAMLPLGIPQVLVHGTADDRVPVEMSQTYAQAAQAAGDPVELIELLNEDHFVLINAYTEAWQITINALNKLLSLK